MRTARPGARLVTVDATCLAAALALAVSPLADLWVTTEWLVAAGAGFVLGVGVTLSALWLRMGPLLTGLVAAAGYLLVGPAAAASDQAIARVLPGPDALRTVLVGVVTSWRSVLTQPVPLPTDDGELVVPLVLTLLGALLATTFLWRSRLPGLAAITVGVVFVGAAALGTHEASFPLARGLLLVVLLLLWTRWRDLRTIRTSWVRRVALGAVVVGVAGAAAWGVAIAATGPERQVLREYVEPPLAELDLRSPLAGYREFYKSHEGDVLFTFDDVPAGDPLVRLATMDQYDGLVWNVTATDFVDGTSVFATAPAASGTDAITVRVGEYAGTWVPTVGSARGASWETDARPEQARELLLNPASGGLAVAGGAAEGDAFTVAWAPAAPRDNTVRSKDVDPDVTIPPMTSPPIEKLDALAQEWVAEAGATTDYERAAALEAGFHDNGFFNDGQSPTERGYSSSGHGARRLADLAEDPDRMVGNDEQYAAAMAYVAQRMGLPARVVLGFEEIGSDGTVTGDDIAAWVEIAFADHGWVAFDPTPSEDRIPPPLQDSENERPQPFIVQPPVLPKEPEDVQGVPPEGSGKDPSSDLWEQILVVLGYLWRALQVVLLLSPVWLVLLLKWLRKRRRRSAADPLARLSGGWREVTDRARDLGAKVPPGRTRAETGALLAGTFAGETAPAGLAAVADRHVFGPTDPTEDEVEAYWDDVGTALKRMRNAVPWWRRAWAVLSPASLPWREAGRGIGDRVGRAARWCGRIAGGMRRKVRRRR